jgi:hypothetical protein
MNVAKLFNRDSLGFRPAMVFYNNSHQFVREKILNTELFVADPTGRDRDINGTTSSSSNGRAVASVNTLIGTDVRG